MSEREHVVPGQSGPFLKTYALERGAAGEDDGHLLLLAKELLQRLLVGGDLGAGVGGVLGLLHGMEGRCPVGDRRVRVVVGAVLLRGTPGLEPEFEEGLHECGIVGGDGDLTGGGAPKGGRCTRPELCAHVGGGGAPEGELVP